MDCWSRQDRGWPLLACPDRPACRRRLPTGPLPLPFNDLAAVEEAFAKHQDEIACVIVEPVVGNMGCVPPAPGYLEGLRRITRETGSLLIFDEVMTGFRLALGGAQQVFGIDPDLTCLGKIIGGGLPCAAFGGKARMMDLLAPLGPVYQAGTLSGNPLAMAAGIATLRYLASHRVEVYAGLEKRTAAVAKGIAAAARDAGIAVETNRVGSMVTWFFTAAPVTDFATAAASDTEAFGRFHRAMLDQGVWLPPSQFEAAFLSAAHTDADIDFTVEAARKAFASMHAVRGLPAIEVASARGETAGPSTTLRSGRDDNSVVPVRDSARNYEVRNRIVIPTGAASGDLLSKSKGTCGFIRGTRRLNPRVRSNFRVPRRPR